LGLRDKDLSQNLIDLNGGLARSLKKLFQEYGAFPFGSF